MRIDIITLFPSFFETPLQLSILGRALEQKIAEVYTHNLRDSAFDRHGTVDDTPYGGGPGMVLKVDVLKASLDSVKALGPEGKTPYTILLTPQGTQLTQSLSQSLASHDWIILICGHYEGFDERIRSYVDLELCIGPYVLSGGEPAALVLVDSILRLLPGATGHAQSVVEESFSLTDEKGAVLLEYPHYTRPENFEGQHVPEVLLNGNHAAIAKWRQEQSKERTIRRYPDEKGLPK